MNYSKEIKSHRKRLTKFLKQLKLNDLKGLEVILSNKSLMLKKLEKEISNVNSKLNLENKDIHLVNFLFICKKIISKIENDREVMFVCREHQQEWANKAFYFPLKLNNVFFKRQITIINSEDIKANKINLNVIDMLLIYFKLNKLIKIKYKKNLEEKYKDVFKI